jgi:WD40 repeat protein
MKITSRLNFKIINIYFCLFFSLYSFDIRYLQRPFNIHKDHVAAVIDVDYAPTGKEFVSGSYDKTVRIFSSDKGHSRFVVQKFLSIFLDLYSSFSVIFIIQNVCNISVVYNGLWIINMLSPVRMKCVYDYGKLKLVKNSV